MATLSRVGMNKARHKAGFHAKQEEESKKRKKELSQKKKDITEEEHTEKIEMLKKLGLIK